MMDVLKPLTSPESRRLLRWVLWGLIIEAILAGIGFVLFIPFLQALARHHSAEAWVWTAILGAVGLLYGGVRYGTQIAGYRAGIALGHDLFARLSHHIASLPLGWFSASPLTSPLTSLERLTSQGVIEVMSVPAHLLRPVIAALVTPASALLLMAFFDWRLALASWATVPLILLGYRAAGRAVENVSQALHEAADHASGRLIEFAQNQQIFRAFGQAERGFQRLDAALQHQRTAGRSLVFGATKGFLMFVLSVQTAFTLILIFGLTLMLGGTLDAAEWIALLLLAARSVEPLLHAGDIEGALRLSRASLRDMAQLMRTPPLKEPETPIMPTSYGLHFDHVQFGYDATQGLQDISFSVHPGQMTAIVGPSGSGKTTILRLAARFWDVEAGRITLGGVDLRAMAHKDLMSQIAMVFQDSFLFDGSLEENIRLARPNASRAAVRHAAKLAHVDEIVARLPKGYGARVGERGATLSGGERQRIAIARALLKDAPILLLDEVTAALDARGEAEILANLQHFTRNKTVIVVAHRLQTIKHAHQILFLDKGRIVERGCHDSLMALEGRYASFWRQKSKNFESTAG